MNSYIIIIKIYVLCILLAFSTSVILYSYIVDYVGNFYTCFYLILVAISPGPDMIIVMKNALKLTHLGYMALPNKYYKDS